MNVEAPDRQIVLTDADEGTRQPDDRCPGIVDGIRCGAGKERRVKSSGFGASHDVCGVCGFEEFDG